MGAWAMLYGVSLICVLDLGQPSVVEEPSCGPGRVQNGTGNNTRCCSLYAPGKEDCPKERCICVTPEYHCGDPQCKICKHYPCQPGQRVESQGDIVFGFQCVDCAMGTFSAGRDGHCRLWTNCSQFGFLTMFPGNKTHDAVCIPEPLPTEQYGHLTVIFLVMAACIFFLTTVQLGLHIWQLRRQHMCPRVLLQRPRHSWRCSCQLRMLAASSSLRRNVGSRWRKSVIWGTGGHEACSSSAPQARRYKTCPDIPLVKAGAMFCILPWAWPCSPRQWRKWVYDSGELQLGPMAAFLI
ncbi:tumor necrosis factor receptor superfamily member 18 isoform X3 [Mus caroli]|uniref:Tumor necrosis factor receptor superfamily member 18 isoform X3 n=1 Tax=Mus caroli TaxID=10089 RepID=A0A6P5PPE5_MUSCR|nr:tumor necrosis factor receptor superfamily member 18 isoform X3 [Mus caroli]